MRRARVAERQIRYRLSTNTGCRTGAAATIAARRDLIESQVAARRRAAHRVVRCASRTRAAGRAARSITAATAGLFDRRPNIKAARTRARAADRATRAASIARARAATAAAADLFDVAVRLSARGQVVCDNALASGCRTALAAAAAEVVVSAAAAIRIGPPVHILGTVGLACRMRRRCRRATGAGGTRAVGSAAITTVRGGDTGNGVGARDRQRCCAGAAITSVRAAAATATGTARRRAGAVERVRVRRVRRHVVEGKIRRCRAAGTAGRARAPATPRRPSPLDRA